VAIPSIVSNPNRPVPTFQRGNPDDLANISMGAIVGAVVVVVLVLGSIGALVLMRRRNQRSGSGSSGR
jgi:hypothetical protein